MSEQTSSSQHESSNRHGSLRAGDAAREAEDAAVGKPDISSSESNLSASSSASGLSTSTREPRTTLGLVVGNLSDEPPHGAWAWVRTTAGVVFLLLALQLLTGVLLSFYYVPSAESAHATVSYIEKVLPAGSWLRALHLYGSQLLPLALALHLLQMLLGGAYRRKPVGWIASLLLLALVLANGATGYSLPWDARAFFSTRVAENVTGGLPLAGATLRAWLVGGAEISTLTVSRFFALHVLVVPALLLAVACARLFVFREPVSDFGRATSDEGRTLASAGWTPAQLARNAVVSGVVFVALALYASKFPAPLGPAAESAPPGYLPRPGAQFLWLFQLLKFFPRPVASLVAFLLPALLLAALALLPFARGGRVAPTQAQTRRRLGLAVFAATALLVAGLTTLARLEDARDPRLREQLARQAEKESEFRQAPFKPLRTGAPQTAGVAETATPSTSNTDDGAQAAQPPEAYSRNCAKCHGPHAEGRSIYPSLVGISARPRRTLEDIVAILNDPRSYGLESRMPSFAKKLTDEEKRAVAEWVVSLK
ncbi:MAG: cytochrome b N-terminal domain-containing protein [Acidobacteriota bacterium]|nr:cytochrome b N-terminal domain-containing protein [Acidobacteriota bacterium]MDQ5835404.1 cytochrome b N-terminal domain-containing protein [Acidobacteriota bacterium]